MTVGPDEVIWVMLVYSVMGQTYGSRMVGAYESEPACVAAGVAMPATTPSWGCFSVRRIPQPQHDPVGARIR